MSRAPCPSRWMLFRDDVFVSTSPVPKIPWPELNSQLLVLMLLLAGPLKVSAQTSFHGGPSGDEVDAVGAAAVDVGADVVDVDAEEQPRPVRTVRAPSPAARRRDQSEAIVRSLAPSTYGRRCSGREAVH